MERGGKEFRLAREARMASTLQCFDYCVSSFKEKLLGAYEKDCINKCMENRVSAYLEIGNSMEKQNAKYNTYDT